jgi:ABC-2 type transport system permease protein
MGSVATEKERGTAALILTKPAGRDAFLLAKIAAIATTLGIATALAAAGAWFYTLVLFEPLPAGPFVAAMVLQWLALVAYAAITFLGSTLTRSALAAAGLGVAAFIVLGILGIVPTLGRYLPTGLGAPARALVLGQSGVDALGPALASAVLVVALFVAAALAFRRQEL